MYVQFVKFQSGLSESEGRQVMEERAPVRSADNLLARPCGRLQHPVGRPVHDR
jgi:hypothetical protein